MKYKIYDIIEDLLFGSSELIYLIQNAISYRYDKKYQYSIEYFDDIVEREIIRAKVVFVINNSFGLFNLRKFSIGLRFENNFRDRIHYYEIIDTKQLAERFDNAMLFRCNQHLKKQTLMDFI